MARLVGIGPRDEECEVAAAGAGRPHLLAGDRPPAVDWRRGRPRAREVGPRARFGEQLAPSLLTAQHRGQVLQPLLVGSVLEEHRRHHLERDGEHLGGDAVRRLHLVDDLVLPEWRAEPAVVRRPRTAGQARVEQPPLPRAADRPRPFLERFVLGGGVGVHDVRGGEVVGVALPGRVGVEPLAHPGLELVLGRRSRTWSLNSSRSRRCAPGRSGHAPLLAGIPGSPALRSSLPIVLKLTSMSTGSWPTLSRLVPEQLLQRLAEQPASRTRRVEQAVRPPPHPPRRARSLDVPPHRAHAPQVVAVLLAAHDQRVVDDRRGVAVDIDEQRPAEVRDTLRDEPEVIRRPAASPRPQCFPRAARRSRPSRRHRPRATTRRRTTPASRRPRARTT